MLSNDSDNDVAQNDVMDNDENGANAPCQSARTSQNIDCDQAHCSKYLGEKFKSDHKAPTVDTPYDHSGFSKCAHGERERFVKSSNHAQATHFF